jgi:CMP-N-acetylneuraminic acid synthetase
MAIYETYCVLFGSPPSDRQMRMQNALTMLNGNWKIGLLLLIPLFYRTVRAFLQRAEEFAGIKAPREPVATRTGKLKPTLQDNSSSKEG